MPKNNIPPIDQKGEYLKGSESRWQPGFKFIIDKVRETGSKSWAILDLGCGTGYFFKFLKKQALVKGVSLENVSFYGVDMEEKYRKGACRNQVNFILADICDGLARQYHNRFDFVICTEVLEHLEDPDKLFDTVKLALKKGGYIFLTTPNLASYHGRLSLLIGWLPLTYEVSNREPSLGKGFLYPIFAGKSRVCIHHIRVFNFKAVRDFLEFHGFEIDRMGGTGYRRGEGLLWRLLPELAPVIWVIAKKL